MEHKQGVLMQIISIKAATSVTTSPTHTTTNELCNIERIVKGREILQKMIQDLKIQEVMNERYLMPLRKEWIKCSSMRLRLRVITR